MEKTVILKAVQVLKQEAKPRKFTQAVDLVVTLRDLNLKNPEEQVDFYMSLPHPVTKKRKICAFTGAELTDSARQVCDLVITQDDFSKYADKKQLRKMAAAYDYFIAQGNLMQKVAQSFGRVLGPRGKMPNPKSGAVIAANANMRQVYERFQSIVRVAAKKEPVIHVTVGRQDMPEEEVIENIANVYDQIIHHLPQEKNNIRTVYLKYTMSKPVKV